MTRRTVSPGVSKTGPTKTKKSKEKPTTARTTAGKPAPSLVLPPAHALSAAQRRSQQQARRRRQTARRVRNFESMVSRVQVPHGALPGGDFRALWRPTKWHPSRLLSLLLLLLAVGTIGWVHYDLEWYVYQHVTFNNLTYHDADVLYAVIDVEGWNIFWLTAPSIRNKLIALPTITDADVQIRPPHWIAIDVVETEPVALWVAEAEDYWLLPDGTALPKLDERYDNLPRIIDQQQKRVCGAIPISSASIPIFWRAPKRCGKSCQPSATSISISAMG
ncbi:MAG: hypothetical protein R2932_19900 [Caldilineaceae bacterium]